MTDILEHYGVKGMRWGQRRARKKALKLRKKAMKQKSKETSFEWTEKYHNRSTMSDDELNSAVRRLRLENDFGQQLARSSDYRPKSTAERVYDKAVKAIRDVSGTSKDIDSIGKNSISSYGNVQKISDLDKIEFKTGKKRK